MSPTIIEGRGNRYVLLGSESEVLKLNKGFCVKVSFINSGHFVSEAVKKGSRFKERNKLTASTRGPFDLGNGFKARWVTESELEKEKINE